MTRRKVKKKSKMQKVADLVICQLKNQLEHRNCELMESIEKVKVLYRESSLLRDNLKRFEDEKRDARIRARVYEEVLEKILIAGLAQFEEER